MTAMVEGSPRQMGGDNWEEVGTESDGTLWTSRKSGTFSRFSSPSRFPTKLAPLTQQSSPLTVVNLTNINLIK